MLYTIGHSTLSTHEFLQSLNQYGIQTLADIRRFPGSRRTPQFNGEALRESLMAAGIGYVHLEKLGGRRKKTGEPSLNTAWQNDSFRNYADYMQTAAFAEGLEALITLAARSVTAFMCAEAVWWRCHRRLVADALVVRGIEVRHILAGQADLHRLTPFARIENGCIHYLAGEGSTGSTPTLLHQRI